MDMSWQYKSRFRVIVEAGMQSCSETLNVNIEEDKRLGSTNKKINLLLKEIRLNNEVPWIASVDKVRNL